MPLPWMFLSANEPPVSDIRAIAAVAEARKRQRPLALFILNPRLQDRDNFPVRLGEDAPLSLNLVRAAGSSAVQRKVGDYDFHA